MFETDPILWLQSGASEPLTAAVRAVSALGYRLVVLGVALVVVLGFDFRRGVVLLQIVWWNEALTGWLKAWWALPRPADVDAAVQLLDFDGGKPGAFRGRDAGGFWQTLPAEVVAHYRELPRHNWGLPSGHVSAVTALWGAIAALWRRWWLAAAATLVVIAMGLARMYLGRHFLADVLAGAGVGSLGVAAAWMVGRRLSSSQARSTLAGRWLWLGGIPLLALAMSSLVSGEAPRALVQMCGFNAGLAGLGRWPVEARVPLRHRAARVLVGLALFAGLWGGGAAALRLWPGAPAIASELVEGLASGAALWLAVGLAQRRGWYDASD